MSASNDRRPTSRREFLKFGASALAVALVVPACLPEDGTNSFGGLRVPPRDAPVCQPAKHRWDDSRGSVLTFEIGGTPDTTTLRMETPAHPLQVWDAESVARGYADDAVRRAFDDHTLQRVRSMAITACT